MMLVVKEIRTSHNGVSLVEISNSKVVFVFTLELEK
jgi:hypothetical protein